MSKIQFTYQEIEKLRSLAREETEFTIDSSLFLDLLDRFEAMKIQLTSLVEVHEMTKTRADTLSKTLELLDKYKKPVRETCYEIDENNVVTVFDKETMAPLMMMPLVDFEELRKFKK